MKKYIIININVPVGEVLATSESDALDKYTKRRGIYRPRNYRAKLSLTQSNNPSQLKEANSLPPRLSLIKKAIDDTFNQVHYSHLHPDIFEPVEHIKWREGWIKENAITEQQEQYTEIEKEAQKWLDETDTMQFSQTELLTMFAAHQTGNSSLGGVMPLFSKQDVIDCLKQRDKEAFDNPYQKYEHREINQAIDIIKRLMPPSSFPNGA